MEKKFKLEPFNIKRVKAGEDVCTRSGENVRIICINRRSTFPIVGLIQIHDAYHLGEERLVCWRKNGKFDFYCGNHSDDLMMKVEVKESSKINSKDE